MVIFTFLPKCGSILIYLGRFEGVKRLQRYEYQVSVVLTKTLGERKHKRHCCLRSVRFVSADMQLIYLIVSEGAKFDEVLESDGKRLNWRMMLAE